MCIRDRSAVESVGIYDTLVSLAGLPRRPSLDELEGLSFAHLVSDGESEAQIASSKAFVQTVQNLPVMGTQFGVRTHKWCYNEHYYGPLHSGKVVPPSVLHEQLHPTQDQLKGIELFDCSDKDVSMHGFPNNLAEKHLDQYDEAIDNLSLIHI